MANDNDYTAEPQLGKLSQKPVYQRFAVDLDHALCVVFSKFPKPPSHSGSKNYRLHIFLKNE
jgi:hypothetical protein